MSTIRATPTPSRTPDRVHALRTELVRQWRQSARRRQLRSRNPWLLLAASLAAVFTAGAVAATGLNWFSGPSAPAPVTARETVATGEDWTLVRWSSVRGLCVGLELPEQGGTAACGLHVTDDGTGDSGSAVSYVDAKAGLSYVFGLVDPRTKSAKALLPEGRSVDVRLFSDPSRSDRRFFVLRLAPGQAVKELELLGDGGKRIGFWQLPNLDVRVTH